MKLSSPVGSAVLVAEGSTTVFPVKDNNVGSIHVLQSDAECKRLPPYSSNPSPEVIDGKLFSFDLPPRGY